MNLWSGILPHICWGCILYTAIFLLSFATFSLLTLYFAIKRIIRSARDKRRQTDGDLHVAFFHPYCNAGGGGERVLWVAIRALQNRRKDLRIVIYTGDADATPAQILARAKNTFNIALDASSITFVYLARRHWVEAARYPYFTLLGQSIGSLVLGLEALFRHQPDVFIDSMGYSFVLPLFKHLGGCRVGCYVHYPTISIDMLRRVQSRAASHNNRSMVAKNPFLTWMKLVYYRLFARLYSAVGRTADTVMVNSSWTENHINRLWAVPFKTHRVYPPCEVAHLKRLQPTPLADRIVVLSVGQFRPEKDHPLQLQAMYELRTLLVHDEALWNSVRLVIVGSCRNEEDEERVKNMRDLAKHLALEDAVEFRVNVSYQELVQCYQEALIGLHAMWNEHFGISVVEAMAAGLIMIANRSGGPLMDIIETSEGSQTGYLAVDAEEYARCIATILYNTKEYNDSIRARARASADRFSEKEFETSFLRAVAPLLE